MITGWNEFTFGRWPNAGVGQLISDSYTIIENDWQFSSNYVDAFSAEFSRDVEPISQLFRDNYYYQMVENIRRFKGVRAVEKGTGSTDIDLSGAFHEFNGVGPVYYDTPGDTAHRDSKNIAGERVVNDSGRNDFVRLKVSKTDKYTYFLAECSTDIVTADRTENWMNLFIDSDQYYYSGWQGYDFVIGRSIDAAGGKLSVEEFAGTDWSGHSKGWADYSVAGNRMVVRVDSALIDLAGRDNFDFKWADNSTVSGEIMEFMDLGDAAPNSRFNYRYIKDGGNISGAIRDTAVKLPELPDAPEKAGVPVPVIVVGATTLLLAAAAVIVVIINRKNRNNISEQ
jgi:hypothetical protein